MPELTGEQLTLVIGAVIAGIGSFWNWFIRPREKRLSAAESAVVEVEKAQAEARASREAFQNYVLARNAQSDRERDEANERAEIAIRSHAVISTTLEKLTGVMVDGNKNVIEEVRVIRSAVETLQRNVESIQRGVK